MMLSAQAVQDRHAARLAFVRHEHPMDGESMADELTRENCAACVLNGYGADEVGESGRELPSPKHASWARIYVQAQRPIPVAWRAAFQAELDSDNAQYVAGLLRDIATFGLVFDDSAVG